MDSQIHSKILQHLTLVQHADLNTWFEHLETLTDHERNKLEMLSKRHEYILDVYCETQIMLLNSGDHDEEMQTRYKELLGDVVPTMSLHPDVQHYVLNKALKLVNFENTVSSKQYSEAVDLKLFFALEFLQNITDYRQLLMSV
nr:hypothetical protein [Moritella viscosa]SHO03655.1 Imidazole glycerol phosphate synthase subunit hisF-IGP synthase cyclase subunit-IGP synthase subunit hisF-ImGP synthase subunit hisF [Moritella viscosa]